MCKWLHSNLVEIQNHQNEFTATSWSFQNRKCFIVKVCKWLHRNLLESRNHHTGFAAASWSFQNPNTIRLGVLHGAYDVLCNALASASRSSARLIWGLTRSNTCVWLVGCCTSHVSRPSLNQLKSCIKTTQVWVAVLIQNRLLKFKTVLLFGNSNGSNKVVEVNGTVLGI